MTASCEQSPSHHPATTNQADLTSSEDDNQSDELAVPVLIRSVTPKPFPLPLEDKVTPRSSARNFTAAILFWKVGSKVLKRQIRALIGPTKPSKAQ